jgi:hypothetical protein
LRLTRKRSIWLQSEYQFLLPGKAYFIALAIESSAAREFFTENPRAARPANRA